MYTQIRCPNCGTPYTAEIHQLVDAGRNPELKSLLLTGQLNVAVCPSCGAATQLATPLAYHDPEHEMFLVYVPQEIQLDHVKREQLIGQMQRQVVDSLPGEQRRAYLFQPTTVLSMQGFLENVLETEGITKEMLARQRKQAELLETLARADRDVADILLKERAREIDETFFAMLRGQVSRAEQADDNTRLIPLLNLQARLMTETELGRRLERQQVALHGLNRDAKEAGGLTPAVMLRHVLRHQEEPEIVDALVSAGAPALNYDFFTGLTAEIDKQSLAGNKAAVDRLTNLRTKLLQTQERMHQESQRILNASKGFLEQLISAADPVRCCRRT
jgi:hypothetical protein